jgi:hypothetical protein
MISSSTSSMCIVLFRLFRTEKPVGERHIFYLCPLLRPNESKRENTRVFPQMPSIDLVVGRSARADGAEEVAPGDGEAREASGERLAHLPVMSRWVDGPSDAPAVTFDEASMPMPAGTDEEARFRACRSSRRTAGRRAVLHRRSLCIPPGVIVIDTPAVSRASLPIGEELMRDRGQRIRHGRSAPT